MTFSDLLALTPDAWDKIPMDALRALGLPVPEPVLEQVCSDHGRNCEFQNQYGALDLSSLRWSGS